MGALRGWLFTGVPRPRNAPKPTAIHAVYQLASLLADLSDGDYYEVVELLRAELGLPASCDFGAV